MTVSFDDVAVVDNHCHGFISIGEDLDVRQWRAMFTESSEEATRSEHAASMVSYLRVMRRLAELLGCEPVEESIVAARRGIGPRKAIALLLDDARVDTLIVDRGFPPAKEVISDDELHGVTDVKLASLLRLEPVMEELIGAHDTVAEVREALRHRLADVRAQGFVGLKSVAAYRSGLDLSEWSEEEIEKSFARAREELRARGSYRLASKPLLEDLLYEALRESSRQELPVQFHVGYGDTDVDLLRSNPLGLRQLLESGRYRGTPFVLLHECYPYTREGAYLAAVYDNVYLDLSYGIPFLGWDELLAFTRAAVAVAPTSKLLYSSDGLGVPELHWASALDAREVLARIFDDCIARRELTTVQARAAGEAILGDNARRLYGLDPS